MLRHFFPEFNRWLDQLPEHRDPRWLYYGRRHLVWAALLMFLLHLRSRLQFSLERTAAVLGANLRRLAETDEETVAHGDTLALWFRRVPVAAVADLLPRMIRRLVRMKSLDAFRVNGYLPVAVDGTGVLRFRQRHCPQCLTQRLSGGGTLYYHPVLEAKLVSHTGLALSMGTHFIENTAASRAGGPQMCEKKAFAPLAEELHRRYPQLRLCLLLDALYADHATFSLCERYGWKFFITFKPGSLPALWDEAQKLLGLGPAQQRRLTHPDGTRVLYRWVNGIDASGQLNALFCDEHPLRGEARAFAWLTNFPLHADNVVHLTHQGGRLRWKIENEGFRVQKQGGFELEHAYCRDGNAARVFYLLLQIAHLCQQLLVQGSLLRPFAQRFVTVRNFVRRLTESLRHELLPPLDQLPPVGQIRWDTS